MQIKFLITIGLFFFLSSCTSTKSTSSKTTKTFKVEIVQNGKVIPIKNNRVQLQKAPYKYRVTLYGNTQYLSVSPSFGTYYYDYPDDKNIYECNDDLYFENCRFVAVKTASETKFNTDKQLSVGGDDYQFNWFYDREGEWHRYDKNVIVKDDYIIAEKTIENVLDLELRDDNGENFQYPVTQINKPIYMVFATSFYESGMEHPKELQREKFIIEFK
ncbi:MAG: hypothetical protein AB8G11_08425 [Saprospiraceae bacterium]